MTCPITPARSNISRITTSRPRSFSERHIGGGGGAEGAASLVLCAGRVAGAAADLRNRLGARPAAPRARRELLHRADAGDQPRLRPGAALHFRRARPMVRLAVRGAVDRDLLLHRLAL